LGVATEDQDLLRRAETVERENIYLRCELMKTERENESRQGQEREKENGKKREEEQIGCISDLYHQNVNQPQKSNILLNNVAEIMLIPNHAEVKKGELNILTTSNTLEISRKFQTEHSQIFRSLFLFLLHLFYDTFETMIQEDSVLTSIGNIVHYLPSTCSCKSEECQHLQQLPSPITKSSQLNKCFVKSDELKSEFLKNVVKGLDWIFRKSKLLNEEKDNIDTLKEALDVLESTKPAPILKCVRIYAKNWISFALSSAQTIEEIEREYDTFENKFLRCLMAVLVNTPFKETDKLEGRPIPIRSYLRYGSIIKSAFNYIGKTHKVRTKKSNCKCCVCTSSFSPENLELIFLENVCSNQQICRRKENFQKVKNLLNCINLNSSSKLKEIFEKIDSCGMETKERSGKRKNENMASSKYQKINHYKERTEEKSSTKKEEIETAFDNEHKIDIKGFGNTDRLDGRSAQLTNILSKFDFDDFPELFKEYQ